MTIPILTLPSGNGIYSIPSGWRIILRPGVTLPSMSITRTQTVSNGGVLPKITIPGISRSQALSFAGVVPAITLPGMSIYRTQTLGMNSVTQIAQYLYAMFTGLAISIGTVAKSVGVTFTGRFVGSTWASKQVAVTASGASISATFTSRQIGATFTAETDT